MVDSKPRHFLQFRDFSRAEFAHLFERTRWIKERFKRYELYQPLKDRTLAMEAVHDPLTQLFNRRYLDSVTPGLIASAHRRGAPLALALLDLDRFKLVNDRHGHPAGDVVLREIGRVLPMSTRPADIVCRYGGEEFCVVLPDADGPGAARALASIAARLRDLRVAWNGETLGGFTFSAGIAVLGRDGAALADLLMAADRALYAAKDAGRDRVLMAS